MDWGDFSHPAPHLPLHFSRRPAIVAPAHSGAGRRLGRNGRTGSFGGLLPDPRGAWPHPGIVPAADVLNKNGVNLS